MNDPVCEVGEPCRSACQGQTWYAEHEGKRYCVLHYPNEEKNADPDTQFQTAVRRKLEQQDFNFAGVYFPAYLEDFASRRFEPRADFSKATFKGGASFAGAKFEGGVDFFGAEAFGEMDFAKVVFGTNGAGFTRTIFRKRASFSEAAFDGVAVFNEAYFMDGASFDESYFTEFAWFQSSRFPAGAHFFAAVFSEGAIFEKARFRSQSQWFVGANFSHVTFEGEANFHSAVLSHATFEGAKFQRSAPLPRLLVTVHRAEKQIIAGPPSRESCISQKLSSRETQNFIGPTSWMPSNLSDVDKPGIKSRATYSLPTGM